MTRILYLILFFLTLIGSQTKVLAYSLDTRITILSAENAVVKVEGTCATAQKHWSFVDFYASSDNLAARISALKFFDQTGSEISFTKQSAGEFETARATNSFSYELKLDYPKNPAHAAHISWLTKERGLLMLGDLLPDRGEETIAGTAVFVLPANWKIAAGDNKISENEFQIIDLRKSVFLIGDFSEQHLQVGKTRINLARAGDWSFTAEETLDFAAKILSQHQKTFDAIPTDNIQLFLIPFPQKFGGEFWEAETRGSTVVLCAANIPYKSRALSKLHEQLRHELFHLWLPNNLNLTGDYAWFYEGFTLYQALKTGIRLKYIRFEDFLDALSRAFDAARLDSNNKSLSLLEASRLRWRGNFSELVYAKGMIVAFVCDLALLEKSGGKKSLDDLFKIFYRQHQKPTAPMDANKAVLEMLKNAPELRSTIENYVEMPKEVDWTQNLTAAGLQNASQISLTRLAVADKLNGRQKKLLTELGYQAIEN
ncbi:MAG: hypothetical protein ABI954_14580 [Pyrinomonadaceae bacterium]